MHPLSEQPPLPPPKDAVYRTSLQGPDVPGPAAPGERNPEVSAHRESFGIEDNPGVDLEEGLDGRHNNTSHEQRKWWNFWDIMTIRARKLRPRYEAEEDEGLLTGISGGGGGNSSDLADEYSYSQKSGTEKEMTRSKKLRFWAIGYGLGLLSVSMLLWAFGAAFFPEKPSDPLANWGKPGTTSEGLSWYPTDFLRDTTPIKCHSHNDYWRKVPLFSALYAGCISVEADVWDFGGDHLLVGHNEASLTPNRTFQSLYINPLVDILKRQNPKTDFCQGTMHGVFDTDHEQGLTILVDVKTDGAMTWPKVLEQLQPLRDHDWLTFVENDVLHKRPITVVGTGETPFNVLMSNSTYRDAFFDSPMQTMWKDVDTPGAVEPSPGDSSPFALRQNLQSSPQGSAGTSPSDDYNPTNSYYASTSFAEMIGTVWFGKLSASQLHLIRGHIAGVHAKGLKVRFWDTPSWPRKLREGIWGILIDEGVDILNVDDLDAVQKGFW